MEKPDKRLHRYLLSTTSRLVGEYDSSDLSITHAWPGMFSGGPEIQFGMRENPYCRNYFVLSVTIEEAAERRVVIPNYSIVGQRCAAVLSILFGKRFDHHGTMLSHGFFA